MMETISLDLTNGRVLGSKFPTRSEHIQRQRLVAAQDVGHRTVLPGTAMERVNRLAAHVTPGLAPQPVSSGILEVPG